MIPLEYGVNLYKEYWWAVHHWCRGQHCTSVWSHLCCSCQKPACVKPAVSSGKSSPSVKPVSWPHVTHHFAFCTSASILVFWLRTQHIATHANSSCQSNPDSRSTPSQKLKLMYVLSQTRLRRASWFATCWRGDLVLALGLGPSWLSCPSMEWHFSLLHSISETHRYELINYRQI